MGSDRPVWQLFTRFSLLLRGPVARYGMALLTFATALLLRRLVDNSLPSGFPYLTFFPAVILTTFMAGLWPGVVTAVLSGLAAWYFFIPPFDSFGLDGSVGLALAFYAVVVAVDIALIHGMQVTLARLQEERGRTASLLEAQTIMFHELQHRVANNMQFVSALLDLQRRTVGHTPEGALAALEEAGRRLHTMAQVHRRRAWSRCRRRGPARCRRGGSRCGRGAPARRRACGAGGPPSARPRRHRRSRRRRPTRWARPPARAAARACGR